VSPLLGVRAKTGRITFTYACAWHHSDPTEHIRSLKLCLMRIAAIMYTSCSRQGIGAIGSAIIGLYGVYWETPSELMEPSRWRLAERTIIFTR
jgi:hypothetical protein